MRVRVNIRIRRGVFMINDFKIQIEEDILSLRERYFNKSVPQSNDWWFNFWVLEKIFYMDGDIIFDNITDNSDHGIDCYYFDEETKDLYLIQNKFYNTESNVNIQEIENFLKTPLQYLNANKYTRNVDLQTLYNNNKDSEEFTVHLQFIVTNNNSEKSVNISNVFKKFNQNNKNKAEFITLEILKNKYFNFTGESRKSFTTDFETINKGTSLNINKDEYDIDLNLNARFIMTKVSYIYKLIKKSKEHKYPLFDENIRDYLGQNVVNKKIKTTLINEEDRKNFFYYNNGITIVCEDFGKFRVTTEGSKFEVNNPQIVNGCQTSSTIYEVLNDYEEVEEQFKDSFVMVKLLKIEKNSNLLNNIVLYNNSQNKVDEKNLETQRGELRRIKNSFDQEGGLCVLLKQSDSNTFKEKFKSLDPEKIKITKTYKKLIDPKKYKDFEVPVEKLLQVILCYYFGADYAYKHKSKILKHGSKVNQIVMEKIVDSTVTISTYYLLWTLFKKLENDQKIDKSILPYYVLMCINKFTTHNNSESLEKLLSNSDDIAYLTKFYMKAVINSYKEDLKLETNVMIKTNINYDLLSKAIDKTSKYMDDYNSINEKYNQII